MHLLFIFCANLPCIEFVGPTCGRTHSIVDLSISYVICRDKQKMGKKMKKQTFLLILRCRPLKKKNTQKQLLNTICEIGVKNSINPRQVL